MQVGVIIPNAGPKTSAENIVATAPPLGIQAKYDLEVTRRKVGKRIAKEVEVRAA